MVTGKRKDPPEGYLMPWSHTTSSLCPVFAVSGSSLSSGVMEELTVFFSPEPQDSFGTLSSQITCSGSGSSPSPQSRLCKPRLFAFPPGLSRHRQVLQYLGNE